MNILSMTPRIERRKNNKTYEYLNDTKCKYCGGNCPNEDDSSEYICDGYRNDPDGLYA